MLTVSHSDWMRVLYSHDLSEDEILVESTIDNSHIGYHQRFSDGKLPPMFFFPL
jgi:hypothetical protein